MATRQQLFSPFGAFVEGRSARQAHDYGQTRNALADLELQDAPAQMQRRNALADVQLQGAQVNVEGAQQQLGAEKAKVAYAKLKQAADSGDPKAFIMQQIPDLAAKLQEQGIDLNSMDGNDVAQLADQLARKYAGEAGMAPASPAQMSPYQQAQIDLERDKMNRPESMTPYQREQIAIEREKLSKPAATDTGPLVQIAGPDGNPVWATRDEAKGKPAYVARDKPAAADVKWQREIKTKLPRLNAALRRMERVEQAVEAISNNKLFDGGEIDAAIVNRTKEGRELVAASAQLLPEITALTRVPGIGSQSDLESRLAALQFPSSEFPPDVNRKNAAELRAFLSDLKDAYSGAEQEIQSSEVQSLLDKYAPQ